MYLVPVLFTFYIQNVPKFNSGAKRLKDKKNHNYYELVCRVISNKVYTSNIPHQICNRCVKLYRGLRLLTTGFQL